jgi:hypothetical protein
MSEYETPETASDEHPLEGGQTDAVDEAQEDARHDAADDDESSDTDPSSMSARAARPGGGEQTPAQTDS